MILRDRTCLVTDPWNWKIYIRKGINNEQQIKVANRVKCFYKEQDEDFIIIEHIPEVRGRKKSFKEGSEEEFNGKKIKSILVEGIRSCKDKEEFMKKSREAKNMLYQSEAFTERQKDTIWSSVWNTILNRR